MFKACIGVDLGSKNTRLALRGGIVSEPSLVSMAACERHVRSVGRCAEFAEYGRVAPIKNGCCANSRLLAELLAELAKKHGGRRGSPRNTELFIALSRTMPLQRLRAFEKAAEAAGFRGARILSRSLMGMLGAGEELGSSRAKLLVDIGAQSICCAAVCAGGIIVECCESFGSELAERAIQNYFASVHRVRIGARTAELMKMNLDRLGFTVDGRSLGDGLPRAVDANADDIRAAALGGMKCIVSFAADMIRLLPPEACADLVDTGVTLIGGGAKMHGIGELFEKELRIKVRVAENAETAAAEGMRRYLFDWKERPSPIINEYARILTAQGSSSTEYAEAIADA